MAKKKTSKQDFKYFESRCRHWIDRLGLGDWHIYIKHEDTESQDNMALAKLNWRAKNCVIVLNANYGGETVMDRQELDDTAFHE